VTDYIDFITSLKDIALNYIKDENEKIAFQNRFENLKDEKANSTHLVNIQDIKI
jgi:hypothetical protein